MDTARLTTIWNRYLNTWWVLKMLFAVYRQSLKEFTRFMKFSPWIILAVLGALLAVFFRSVSAATNASDQFTVIVIFYTFRIGTLAAAILATNILNAEVEQKTIVYLLTRPIPRWTLLLGRYLACFTAVSIVSVVAVISTGLGVFGTGAFHHHVVWLDCLAAIFGSLAYCGFFLLMSVLSNRSLIINLLVAFGWEITVPSLPGTAYLFSILTYMLGIHLGNKNTNLSLAAFSNLVTNHNFSIVTCLAVLAGVAAVCAGIATVVFSVSEFIPKEQAA